MEDYKKTELLSSRIIPQGTEDDHEDTIIATPLLSPPLQIKLNYVEYHAYEFDLSIPAHKSKVSAQKRFFRFLPVFTIVVVKIGVVYWLVWLPMRYIVFPEIIVLIWLLVLILLFFWDDCLRLAVLPNLWSCGILQHASANLWYFGQIQWWEFGLACLSPSRKIPSSLPQL